jgi:hypothetical protein
MQLSASGLKHYFSLQSFCSYQVIAQVFVLFINTMKMTFQAMQFSFLVLQMLRMMKVVGWLVIGQIGFYAMDEIFRTWRLVTCPKI